LHREEAVNGSAKGTVRNLFDGILKSDAGRWAVVSLAGGPDSDRPSPRDAAGREVIKPISHYLPVESVVGVPGETVLAVLILILVSLVAGLRQGAQP
jgi:hypothetical protein